MYFSGLIIGALSFLIIGVLHPVVIKAEYYFGKKCWPLFAVGGVVCCAVSLFVPNSTASILLAVLGFSFFWSIHEIIEQESRVKKGWFPANPKRVAAESKDTAQEEA